MQNSTDCDLVRCAFKQCIKMRGVRKSEQERHTVEKIKIWLTVYILVIEIANVKIGSIKIGASVVVYLRKYFRWRKRSVLSGGRT